MSSPRLVQSARCPVRELAYPRVVQLPESASAHLHGAEPVSMVDGDAGQLVGVPPQHVPQLGGHVVDLGVPVTVVQPDEARLTHRLVAVAAVDGQRAPAAGRVRSAAVLGGG